MALPEMDGRIVSTIRTDLVRDAHALADIDDTNVWSEADLDPAGDTLVWQAAVLMRQAADLLTQVVSPNRPSPLPPAG